MQEYTRSVEEIEPEERPYLFGRRIFQGDTLEMAQVSLKPGAKMITHSHPDGEQCYYVLAGRGRLVIEGTPYDLYPGIAAFVPLGSQHYTENTGDGLLTYVEARSKAVENSGN
ncbi:MAG: cupin domain-containing protein [Ardenticatenaceae bacterium]|nr:cupin domain-containing protein [Ardenticatenaceae bacterium]HBY93214.1 hypothetical protein [Chloroflexota bacterium]